VLRIGFVGSGVIAWAHALGLRAMIDAGVIDASIVAVHDPRERRAQGFIEAVGSDGAAAVGDAAEVSARADAVWVCTPTAAHRAAVDEALAGRRALFCEKPLDTDLTRARALVEAAAAAGVPCQSGLVLRTAPVFRALQDLVASGELGEPMAAVFRDDQYFPIQGMYASKWRADVAQAGGGCLIEHSIHDVDILRFCFGEVDEVTAHTENHAGHAGVEDVASVSLGFASGMVAQLTSVWHEVLSRGSTRRVEVFCRQGTVWLDDDFRGPLHVQTSEAAEVRPCPSPEWVDALPLPDDAVGLAIRAYVEADRSFVDAVTSGRTPEPGLGVALEAHRLVDAAYRSAAGGGLVDVRTKVQAPGPPQTAQT
jgi:myo-inositol 2-dehydrogenase/D-chiro-inositol 1-dehydrogenase